MSPESTAATNLARRALEVLNTEGTDAVRAVLESVLRGSDLDGAILSSTSANRRRFGRALLACTVGRPYWRQIRHALSDSQKVHGSPLFHRRALPGREPEESALDLARRWLSANPQTDRNYIAEAVLFINTASSAAAPKSGLHDLLAECTYSVWDGTEQQALETLLQSRAVDRRLTEHSIWRLLYLANQAGMTQRQIARLVREPQATVNRRLRQLESDPQHVAMSPSEIVDRYLSDQIDRAVMLSLLASYPYDRGEYPTGAEDWAYVPGSWDELTRLTVEGDVTADEFDFIVRVVEERAQHAVSTPA